MATQVPNEAGRPRWRVFVLVVIGALACSIATRLAFDGRQEDRFVTTPPPADSQVDQSGISDVRSRSEPPPQRKAVGPAAIGTVRYENGDAASGCVVEVVDRTQAVLLTTETSSDGRFEVAWLRDDAVRLRVVPPHGPASHHAFDRSGEDGHREDRGQSTAEWRLPDIVIPDVSLLPLQVVSREAHESQDGLAVYATIRDPTAIFGSIVPPVRIPVGDLAAGVPSRFDVIVPSRRPLKVEWSLGSEWSWQDVALATQPTALNPVRNAEYEECSFNVSGRNAAVGRVIDGEGRPVPQTRVSVRWGHDGPGGRYSHTRADACGKFLVGCVSSWPGRARAALDDVVSEWKEFQPGEDIIVRFTHPVVRLVVRLHDGTPVTTAAFRTQCQFARTDGKRLAGNWRPHLRDCTDGVIVVARERILKGDRYFIYVPEFGETPHVFERTVEVGEADPYIIALPEAPGTIDLELALQVPQFAEGRVDLTLHELTADFEPMRYSLSLPSRSGPITIEDVQRGTYRYEARIGNDPNVRTGTVVISDEVPATLRLEW